MGPGDVDEMPGDKNVFDNLPAYRQVEYAKIDELSRYLYTEIEDVKNEDLLRWWHEHRHAFPHLYRMALDYHTVPCKFCFCFCFSLVYSILTTYLQLLQVPPLKWSVSSAKDASFYLTFATASLRNRRVHSCALETGADVVS